jgi:ankyrin repeat protein
MPNILAITAAAMIVALPTVAVAQVRDDALYQSIVAKRVDGLDTWLSSGGDPNARLFVPDSDRTIPVLELATRAGNESAILTLLGVGADIENQGGFVPLLEMAAQKGMVDAVNALIARDPTRLSTVNPRNNPLVLAVGHGHREVVLALLDSMPAYLSDTEWQNVLNEALVIVTSNAAPDSISLASDLLRAGADVQSMPVLAGAAIACSVELVKLYLANGADPNQLHGGQSPLDYGLQCFAKDREQAGYAILSALVEAGADACSVDVASPDIIDSARIAIERIRSCE